MIVKILKKLYNILLGSENDMTATLACQKYEYFSSTKPLEKLN